MTLHLALSAVASKPFEVAASGLTLALFVAYLLFTIGIGIWAARRGSSSQESYFLGGRSLSPLVVALSAVSSGRSAWLVLGASGIAWKQGLSALWLFPGYIVAEFIVLGVMGKRLRTRSAQLGAITVPEVLGGCALGPDGKAGSAGPAVRRVAGAIVVLFLVSYVSAQLMAGGKALQAVFPDIAGESYGLLITAGIVVFYTLVGGYRAVAITDVLQALLMLVGLVVLPVVGLAHVGGFAGLRTGLAAIEPALLNWSAGLPALLAGVAIGLGSFGSPPILVRAMSIAKPEQLLRAAYIGITWNIVMAAGAFLIGLVGRVVYPTVEAFAGGDTEQLYPMLGSFLSAQYLFAGFVGVLLAALFAAIMSTCDSQLLVIASSFVRDFRGERSGGGADSGIVGSRGAVLGALILAALISYGAQGSVHTFVLFSWDALGAAFGPALLFVLFQPRTTARGVLAAMVVGVAVTMGWGQFVRGQMSWAPDIHQRILGFGAACIALVTTLRPRGRR